LYPIGFGDVILDLLLDAQVHTEHVRVFWGNLLHLNSHELTIPDINDIGLLQDVAGVGTVFAA
jgi:hypothetical protein